MMENADLFLRFGVALAIGFLIGLQREFAHGEPDRDIIAGERTFALFGLAGALAAMAADELNSALAFVGILIIFGAFITASFWPLKEPGLGHSCPGGILCSGMHTPC